MTFTRLHISVFLGLSVAVWAVVLLAQGRPLSKEYLAPFSTVVAVMASLGIVFERLLWHHPWLHGWLVKRPDLRGTWRVELQSDWIDPQTRSRIPLTVCYMGVEQTLSTLHMHLMTPESESWFIADGILPSPNGIGYQLIGVYTNKPQMRLRGERSEMHQGAIMLHTHGPPGRPETLTGEYWTDRKTAGQMTFTKRVPRLFTRYEDASEQFPPIVSARAAHGG